MDVRKVIFECFEENGMLFDMSDTIDYDLRDMEIESIQFISALVSIESKLEIEIPDELLLYDTLASFNSFCAIIEDITKNNTKNCSN